MNSKDFEKSTPYLNALRGHMRVTIFSGKGVLLECLSGEDFPRKPGEDFPRKPGKGGVFCKKQWLPITEIGGISFPDRGFK